MDKTGRFRLCDPRFHVYLKEAIDRLPAGVKEEVLSNEGLQILSDKNFGEMCALHYAFDCPIKNLIYLNTKLLDKSKHLVIYTIAHEIAVFFQGEERETFDERETERMLIEWGFGDEVEAVRYDRTIAESEGYRVGYEWAKRQDKEYLQLHFGLYFDEWNRKGLKRMKSEQVEMLHAQPCTPSVPDNLDHPKMQTHPGSKEEPIVDLLPLSESMVAGIMAAVKEARSLDASSATN